MKRGPKISTGALESALRGKMNRVGKSVVERPIILVVDDFRTRMLKYAFSTLDRFPFLPDSGRIRRYAINLFAIEHGVDTVQWPITGLRGSVWFGLLADWLLTRWARSKLPELDMSALFTLSNLPTLLQPADR